MRNKSYFYQLIYEKRESKLYGDLPYNDRVKSVIDLYENLSSMEKLEFQEAIRSLLKSADPVLVEIAISICTGFIDRGFNNEQQFKILKQRILKG